MPKKKPAAKEPKLRPDANEIAYRTMLEATGQAPKTVPPSERTELHKTYKQTGSVDEQRRYSPAVCTGTKKIRVIGRPNPDEISTSMVERSNLSLRMTNRRFTRLTSGFSKKAENHAHAVSLTFFAYNFCAVHRHAHEGAEGHPHHPGYGGGNHAQAVDDGKT